ncbi:MAG: lipocalin family protein [Gelidibacter sp.]
MKNIFKILWFIPFVGVMLFTACSKDDGNDTPEPTVEELLTTGIWYFESQTFTTLDACDKHTNLRLLTNGNFVQELYNDAGGTCDVSATIAGTFVLVSDDTFILSYGTTTVQYTIITVSEDELILQFDGGGDTPITAVLDKNPGDD